MHADGTRLRLLAGAALTLTWTPQDQHGEPTTTAAPIQAKVYTSDGTLVSTQNFVAVPYTVALAAGSFPNPELLDVTWSDTTNPAAPVQLAVTGYELVGGFYFTSADLRDREPSLADGQRDPVAKVLANRAEVETLFERATRQCFVPRLRAQRIQGDQVYNPLRLDRTPVRAVRWLRLYNGLTLYYTFSAAECAAVRGSDAFSVDLGRQVSGLSVEIGYEVGHRAPPDDVRRAAMTACRLGMNRARNGLSESATSYTTDAGQTVMLATPGVRNWHTGIPSVDEVLMAYDLTPPL